MCRIKKSDSHFKSPFTDATILLLLICFLLFYTGAHSATNPEREEILYLKGLSLEQLANIEITSVSKRPEKLNDAAAAVFVVTQEDIHRSGATNIPEILRMVPGVQVARIDANKWAVTARGFNGSFASKLLVLIDGRSVYSPLWSGVFWNIQDPMLEDIERIEVIRGPGASLWGANAVNGIVNIITKSASESQGGLVNVGVGTEERAMANIRYGFSLSDYSHMRLYAKYSNRDDAIDMDGGSSHDSWQAARTGFRLDSNPKARHNLTFQGDLYLQQADATYEFASILPPTYLDRVEDESDLNGGNLLGRWVYDISDHSQTSLQMYLDHTSTQDQLIDEARTTFDIDFQHQARLQNHDIIWGTNYRNSADETKDTRNIRFDPQDETLELFSIFLQDQVEVLKDKLWLTLGAKFENHTYTDWEIQPTARFLWKATDNQSVWGAISRAVRTPSRAERDVQFDAFSFPPNSVANPSPLPAMVQINGSSEYGSEDVVAYELGYRALATKQILCDIAVFYNDYSDLAATKMGPPAMSMVPPPSIVLPQIIANENAVDSSGLEVALSLTPKQWWKLDLAYTYLALRQENKEDGISGSSPRNQLSLRSIMDLKKNIQLDLWLRYVDELTALDIENYLTFDMRLAWQLTSNLELALIGQNLVEDSQLQFIDQFIPVRSSEVERGVYTKLTWTF